MDITAIKEAFDWFLVRACLSTLTVLFAVLVIKKAYRLSGKLKNAVKRYGWSLVILFIVCSAWATYTAYPTLEEKEEYRQSQIAQSETNSVWAGIYGVDGGAMGSSLCQGYGGQASCPTGVDDESEITNCTLTPDDVARGFVLTRIGTNEVHDFTSPTNAVVYEDWLAHGASEDWFYLAFENWAFLLGTNEVERLRVFSYGEVDPLPSSTNTYFAPFKTLLGVVPEANWHLLGNGEESLFWHEVTSLNTLKLTWQNVLYNRETNTPASFQMELWPNGNFTYRYDLSRTGLWDGEAVSNVLIGAAAGGLTKTIDVSALTNLTSLAFYRLNPNDTPGSDRDGDGLTIEDELFVYHTDPHNTDSDYDGLTDSEELFTYNTDPLNPYSVSEDFCDGVAVKIGNLNLMWFPEGSTNTILEHVFYSGTTNGTFSYPQSSESVAVLKVSVSGYGTGDLIVGGNVVPLVAPMQQRNLQSVSSPPLFLSLEKGKTHTLQLRGGEQLNVELASEDFAFGLLPSCGVLGRINFPYTKATLPCIHDFNARSKEVNLPMGGDAQLLTCTWQGGASVGIENKPPRSAVVSGDFHPESSESITYTLAHPEYLFGKTVYPQTVRYCPCLEENEPDDPESPEKPFWDENDEDDDDDNSNNPDENYDQIDFDENCPVHSVSYEDCAYLHEAEYEDASENNENLEGVLYIRDTPQYNQIYLEVSSEPRNCCECPDHQTNYVEMIYQSHRLKLTDQNGLPFSRTERSCDVNLAGIRPSSSVGDATVVFARNGEIYRRYDNTVLGVGIRGSQYDVAACNSLNASFGYPITVCTTASDTSAITLVTNVKLPDGNVHLELKDATGQFTVWYYDGSTYNYRKLLDTQTTSVKNLTMDYWKALMYRAVNGATLELPIYLTSSTPGSATLLFRYWNVINGKFVQDTVSQRITSVLPPLMTDLTRDGAIDESDISAHAAGKTFRYWTNEDTDKGDYVGQNKNTALNSADLTVNGRLDLVNLFPVKLDIKPFVEAWGNGVRFVLWSPESGNFRFCGLDAQPSQAWTFQTNDVYTAAGDPVHTADLISVSGEGVDLEPSDYLGNDNTPGVLAFEAVNRVSRLDALVLLVMDANDNILFSYNLPLRIYAVKDMYSWYNFRRFSGDNSGRSTDLYTSWEENYDKALIFLHGANVSSAGAEKWGDAIFKRMWLSGMRARFYNIDWKSDIGNPANYHENASNAFVVASQIASAINAIPGEKVIMAHSLGNMVVSSMIQDYGLQVSKYLMCNSAVPAEAYDRSLSLRVSQLVHPDWEEYPTNSWAASWHSLFENDANDDRKHLGWSGRFADVIQYAVNFYSTGDEVLELSADNDVDILTGITSSLAHHAWHKQELFKGRGLGVGMGATDWSGWNIEENWLGITKISVEEAQMMNDADFKTNTVFYCYPSSMNVPNIPLLVRGAHLAFGIPALTPAAGVFPFGGNLMLDSMVNVDADNSSGVERPNGWPMNPLYPSRWLHSDIKNVSYFFNYKFYEIVMEKGGLK